jgi:hypothetical protein
MALKIIQSDGTTRDMGQSEMDAMGEAVRRNVSAQEDDDHARKGDGWEGAIYGACPLQGEGTVDGFAWYFRARGSSWSFEVSDSFSEADIDATHYWDRSKNYWCDEGTYGTGYDASWMPFSVAWNLIESAIATYRASKSTPRTPRS